MGVLKATLTDIVDIPPTISVYAAGEHIYCHKFMPDSDLTIENLANTCAGKRITLISGNELFGIGKMVNDLHVFVEGNSLVGMQNGKQVIEQEVDYIGLVETGSDGKFVYLSYDQSLTVLDRELRMVRNSEQTGAYEKLEGQDTLWLVSKTDKWKLDRCKDSAIVDSRETDTPEKTYTPTSLQIALDAFIHTPKPRPKHRPRNSTRNNSYLRVEPKLISFFADQTPYSLLSDGSIHALHQNGKKQLLNLYDAAGLQRREIELLDNPRCFSGPLSGCYFNHAIYAFQNGAYVGKIALEESFPHTIVLSAIYRPPNFFLVTGGELAAYTLEKQ